MTTALFVVRHGETEYNRRGLYQGHADSPLTETGRAQARLLAPRSRQLGCGATVYCSDLGRARSTAELLVEPGVQRIRTEADLRERGYGTCEGMSRTEIAVRHPEVAGGRVGSSGYTPPGGETMQAFIERIRGAFERIAGNHAGGRVLVVTHGGVVTAFARHVLGIPAEAPRRFDVDNTSLSCFYRHSEGEGEGDWMVRYLGDTAHLQLPDVLV